MVLRYIYGGRLSLEEYDTSDIIKILVASIELNLQELINHLQLFLIENKRNWMEQNFNLIYQTSFENDSFLKLQHFCSELMFKEPEKIFNSIDFTSLSEKCLISLIRHDNFQMKEIQVWEHVLKWGIAQNPELPSDPSSYSKDDFSVLKNTLLQFIPLIKFHNLTPNEFVDKPNKNLELKKDFNIMVNEINDFIYKLVNEALESKSLKQEVIEYFNDHNINAREIYDWLLNYQVSTNSIFLLGYYNFYGIITSLNREKAFNMFINASEKNHTLAQYFVGNCYNYGFGTIKNEKLSFEYYEKAANNNYAEAQFVIGNGYRNGVGIEKNFKKAFYWYEKAAHNGNLKATHNLGNCYIYGIGVEKDRNKAFELFKQSAEGGDPVGIRMLGYCYNNGIGTKIDNRKAFELYYKVANLGDEIAQYRLAIMHEEGNGIIKDKNKAIYWYSKSANQGHEKARNNLERLQYNNLW
ncbi:kinase-like domain-containing protein [Rhizophagus clarus]|uniref:Kinase-like domain-containing protein n=1 Tax=Rhizophagus clarus TaxID=94130 RepID=A0A8H3QP75_9GLOM|nr:kinase-like domain-containing protein [Rhizophagus clarus]